MPSHSQNAARRTGLRKGDDAKIPMPPEADVDTAANKADGDMSDDGKKPWDKDDASKGDDDKPWDKDDDTSKADDDEDDDEDEDDDSVGKSQRRSARFRADLAKAVKMLARHGEMHDPAMRKEALLAKELKGGGLSKSERGELVGILTGRADGLGVVDEVVRSQSPGPSLRKSMVDNSAMAEAYDNITKSVHAQARFLDETAKNLEATSFAMARALVKASETIGAVADRQDHMAQAIESLAGQPAHTPRSIGLGWAEKSFAGEASSVPSRGARGGRLEKSSPQKIRQALGEMAKSAGPRSAQAQAYKMAADGLLMNRAMLPSVAAQVEQHLSEHDG